MPATLKAPASLKTPSQGTVRTYPQLQGLDLPQQLIQAIQQSFQATYGAADQANNNANQLARIMQYGPWDNMWQTNPTSLPDGTLWFVTDRPNLCYQIRMDPMSNQLQWFAAVGVQWDQTQASQLHGNLTQNDAGYMVAGLNPITGATASNLFVWDGTKWITLI